VYAGAVPVLAEVDDSLTIDPADIRAKITPRTKAIMPVHMLGVGADLDPVTEVAREHGVVVLEDVAQACGGSYRGRRLGTIGDAGAFSLNYFKVITAGEGGFLLTGSAARYERAYAFHDHGFRPFREGAVEADTVFGLNLRMADLIGAVALAQVGRIDEVLGRLRTVKERLAEAVGDLPGVRRRTRPDPTGDCATALIYVFDDAEHANKTAALLGTATLISSGRHYYGNMPQLRRLGTGSSRSVPFQDRAVADPDAYRAGSLPRTDCILARSLALSTGTSDTYAGTGFGVLPTSTEAEIDAVAATFRAAVLESA
jgi:dTDP-4-amino-4,6-dideoxygalactose transaminase